MSSNGIAILGAGIFAKEGQFRYRSVLFFQDFIQKHQRTYPLLLH
jgi:hypothetical protein